MATFPAKFKILRDNYTEGLSDRTITSQMDVGPAKRRRRTFLVSEKINVTVKIEISDADEFKQFFYANDVSVFDFRNPRTGLTQKVRFASIPSMVLNETYYTSSFDLEILP